MSRDLPDLPGAADHLELCLRLAEEALEAGDGAFGSVLVDGAGAVLRTGRNREVSGSDPTAHPELELAQCAASSAQLSQWRAEWGLTDSPVAALPIDDVAPRVRVHGPVPPYDDRVRELHRRGLER